MEQSAASVSAGSEIQSVPKKRKEKMIFYIDEVMGTAFGAFAFILFPYFFYASIVSKLLPPYENWVWSAIQNDRYYCLLVPLTLL